MPKPFFELFEISLIEQKSNINFFELQLYKFKLDIQTRHIRDHMGKENTTISLMEWMIIMFDHESVTTMNLRSFYSLFACQIKKFGHQKNMRLKGLTCITSINLWLLKIYSTIFGGLFLMWFFLQHLVYLRLISKSPQHYEKSRLQWTLLHKILNRKIILIICKIKFLMIKLDSKRML